MVLWYIDGSMMVNDFFLPKGHYCRSQVAIYFSTFSAPLRRTEVDQGNCVTADGEMAGVAQWTVTPNTVDPRVTEFGKIHRFHRQTRKRYGDLWDVMNFKPPQIARSNWNLFGANRNADYCWFNWGNGNVMDMWRMLIVYHPAWGFISPFEALKQQMSTIQTGLGTQRFWWYLSESNLGYHLVMTFTVCHGKSPCYENR